MNIKARTKYGFSLVELVVAIAVVATIAAVGFGVYTNYRKPITGIKMDKDVATLNNAVAAYLTAGGNLDGVTDLEAVLAKLKTKASSAQAAEIAGQKGSVLDSRVKAVMQTTSESTTSEPRVVWNATDKRFRVATSGLGAKEIVLTDTATAAAEESRHVSLKLATEDKWVWDYEDRNLPGRSTYTEVVVAQVTPTTPTGAGSGSSGPLLPPEFSIPGGAYALTDYDLTVSLSDPNAAGLALIMYSINGGSWNLYSSGALAVQPDTTISAYCVTNDPDYWSDSPVVSETYVTIPVELELAFTSPELIVNYAEVGGAMIPGTSGTLGPLAPGTVSLNNSASVPAQYQNDSVFTVHWTYDGSDPITSGTRQSVAPFAGGFPDQPIDYSLAWWGSSSVLPVQAAAQSFDTSVVTDSVTVSQVFSVDQIFLRAPTITFVGSDVHIDLVTDYGDMPVGARIYYTVDGTDPGDLGGVPTSGTLYTGPFAAATVPGGNSVKARVYGPDTFEHWFTASGITTETPPLATILFSMTVSTSAP